MPWPSLLSFLITFMLQKKAGRSNATAALSGLAVGAATYMLADPANPDNLFQIGVDSTKTSGGKAAVPASAPATVAPTSGLSNLAGQTVTTAGNVLTSWGPKGTALVAGTATALNSENVWVWAAVGLGLLLLLK